MSAEKNPSDTAVPADHVAEYEAAAAVADTDVNVNLPPGWKYKQRRFLGISIPWYASPQTQLILVSFVCFLCPGMFNALGGLGGGGKTDATLADHMVRILSHPFNY
jgi:hypothetical protein